MFAHEDFNYQLNTTIAILVICIAVIVPAHADLVGDILNIGSPVFEDEYLVYTNSTEYFESQWKVSNFTVHETQSDFWITNYESPDISLPEIIIKNHDTKENMTFNYTKKTTILGNETTSIWNLFGILNPDSKISKGEMCQIQIDGAVKNIEILYKTSRKVHWGGH